MLLFPNCKINLGLSILEKRNDGYHNLETVFYPLPVKDALEIIPDLNNGVTRFSTSGLKVDGNIADNLCLKAYYLLQKDFPQLPPVQMHLHKFIPMGAGLGGGSADGAFGLKLLNSLFNLQLSDQQLVDYAQILGSDCPFFILNKPCFATGRGEIMEPVALDLSGNTFVLVNAGIAINTGWAFSRLNIFRGKQSVRSFSLKEIIAGPLKTWKDLLFNDFEKPVFDEFPEIGLIKDRLYEKGALYASMTGSGSTVFGIFDGNKEPELDFPKSYQVIIAAAGKYSGW